MRDWLLEEHLVRPACEIPASADHSWQIVTADAPRDRAVVVALRGDRMLAIRRRKSGRHYAVLPGGGVEADEAPHEGVLRELREETGLPGVVLRHLWTLAQDDRRADYFLVEVPELPMVVSGPEEQRQSSENSYEPCWIALTDLESENLQPDAIRALVRRLAGTP